MENNNTKISGLILKLLLVVSIGVNIWLIEKVGFGQNQNPINQNQHSAALINSPANIVSAKEIYPLFECSCCGKSIDKCTCPMAQERRTFVDGLVAGGLSEEKVVMAYVKNYGLDSFMSQEKQKEFRRELVKEAPADRPIISLNPDSYDFGDVSQKQGTVTTFFEIENKGRKDLVINKLDSSCGCTSASIIYRGQEGPRFYMTGHGKENPTDWQVNIPAGQTAQVKVYYDPDIHKDFRGPATREISVFSNDPIDFEKKVKIELNQVD